MILFSGDANIDIGVFLWGPPWDPGDVFRMFFDDFFGLLGSKKPNFTPDPKIFYFAPCEGPLRGAWGI